MIHKHNRGVMATAAAALLLAGCSTSSVAPVTRGVSRADAEAAAAMERLRKGEAAREGDSLALAQPTAILRVQSSYLPVTKVEPTKAENQKVTASLNREVAVNRKFSGLKEMVGYVTQLTGLPVVLAPEVETIVSAPTAAQPAAPSGSGSSPSNLPPAPMGFGGSQVSGTAWGGAAAQAPTTTYNGKLDGFLDVIATSFGIAWEPSENSNSVLFYRTKSRTFRLAALPGNTNMSAKINRTSAASSSSSATASTGSSEQKTGVEFSELNVWKGIEDSMKLMLSPVGKVVVTPATGTITVTDIPSVLVAAEKFVNDQNVALSRQVVINVRVLQVDLTDSDAYGINWDAIYTSLGGGITWALANIASPITGATSLKHSVVSGSRWAGSSAMIEALSKQGKVSQITSASMVTLNNQPAPVQVGKQTGYIASSTTTIGTGGAGNTISLTPGSVTTGFSLSMLPHILDGNRMMLQYSGDISALMGMHTVTSGTSSIQTPEVDTRNFLQRVVMNSGETLIVTGFEQFNLSGKTQGVGNAENVALGGSVDVRSGKSVLVILIQPVLIGPQS